MQPIKANTKEYIRKGTNVPQSTCFHRTNAIQWILMLSLSDIFFCPRCSNSQHFWRTATCRQRHEFLWQMQMCEQNMLTKYVNSCVTCCRISSYACCMAGKNERHFSLKSHIHWAGVSHNFMIVSLMEFFEMDQCFLTLTGQSEGENVRMSAERAWTAQILSEPVAASVQTESIWLDCRNQIWLWYEVSQH